MPNFTERIMGFDIEGLFRGTPIRDEKNLNPLYRLRQYLLKAGFVENELRWLTRMEDDSQDYDLSRDIDQEFANLFARIVPPGQARREFFSYSSQISLMEDSLSPIREITRRLAGGENLSQLINDLRLALEVSSKVEWARYYDIRTRIGYEIINYPPLYQIFGSDPLRLGEYISRSCDGHYQSRKTAEGIITIIQGSDTEFKERLLACLTEADLCLEENEISPALSFGHEDYWPLVLKHYKSDRSWAARLDLLWESFAFVGLPQVTDEEVDDYLFGQFALQRACQDLRGYRSEWADLELPDLFREFNRALIEDQGAPNKPLSTQFEALVGQNLNGLDRMDKDDRFLLLHSLRKGKMHLRESVARQPAHHEYVAKHQEWLTEIMARARRRESPRHPLVSLGIAKTVGFEVEYPIPELEDRSREGIFHTMMTRLGLRYGSGGGNSHEVSPGPFYDPATALALLRMYSDIGYLDFYLHPNMTCHFNLGIENADSFAFLVWNMYLSGAVYNPANSLKKDVDRNGDFSLKIFLKNRRMGEYLEGKVYDAMTESSLAWTISSGGYLAWARAAADDVNAVVRQRGETGENGEDLIPVPNHYRQELARIWRRHEAAVRRGAKRVGLGKIFHSTVPRGLTQELDKQIGLVYPDVPSRYLDPATVSKRTVTDGGTARVVRPIAIKRYGKTWPNIVAYIVDVTDRTVSRIKEIEARVEADCLGAIKEIEASPNKQKRSELLDRFIENFAVVLPENATQDDKWGVYSEVKALFQDQL